MKLRDRAQAGRLLAGRLGAYAGRGDVLVLALPRGGVPVGFEVARALAAPLDVLIVRKLGVPGHEELAMGAIASGGGRFVNEEVTSALGIAPATIEAVAALEATELARRARAYRGDRPAPEVAGRTVILVDDGLATGSTMIAAAAALRARRPARLVVAVPVAPPSTLAWIAAQDGIDEVHCLVAEEPFHAVGAWYEEFPQLEDEAVRALLERTTAP